jgi:lactobin A/cerein 7B family class IIb bacteriocin
MNTSTMGPAALDLQGMGVQLLDEKEVLEVTGGINPVIMAGFYVAAGAAGVLAVGVAAGIAVYYFTH